MGRKEYRSEKVTVSFELGRCIHSGECARGLPEVFDPRRRPWVRPGGSDPALVAEVVMRCPTGALRFVRRDGGAQEPVPEENLIAVGKDGPLYVRGDVRIESPLGDERLRETRVALCRCGESRNQPFCDNSHKETNFRHDGSLGEDRFAAGATPKDGRLRVVPSVNGPLLLKGAVEIRDASGGVAYHGTKAALCRCGRSENKPFCDGSHARTGWSGQNLPAFEEREVKS